MDPFVVPPHALQIICYKSAGVKNTAIKVTCAHEMTCRHAVYLSVALSLLATTNTAYFALGLDFVVNLVICLKIIWRTKKISKAYNEREVDARLSKSQTIGILRRS